MKTIIQIHLSCAVSVAIETLFVNGKVFFLTWEYIKEIFYCSFFYSPCFGDFDQIFKRYSYMNTVSRQCFAILVVCKIPFQQAHLDKFCTKKWKFYMLITCSGYTCIQNTKLFQVFILFNLTSLNVIPKEINTSYWRTETPETKHCVDNVTEKYRN